MQRRKNRSSVRSTTTIDLRSQSTNSTPKPTLNSKSVCAMLVLFSCPQSIPPSAIQSATDSYHQRLWQLSRAYASQTFTSNYQELYNLKCNDRSTVKQPCRHLRTNTSPRLSSRTILSHSVVTKLQLQCLKRKCYLGGSLPKMRITLRWTRGRNTGNDPRIRKRTYAKRAHEILNFAEV